MSEACQLGDLEREPFHEDARQMRGTHCAVLMDSPSAISAQLNRDRSFISLCTCLFFRVGADFGDSVAQLRAKGSNILWGSILHWQRKWMQRVVVKVALSQDTRVIISKVFGV